MKLVNGVRIFQRKNALMEGSHHDLVEARAVTPVTAVFASELLEYLTLPRDMYARQGRYMTYGTEPCWNCAATGKTFGFVACPVCKGTRKGFLNAKGKYRQCTGCQGTGEILGKERTVECSTCNGTIAVPEDRHVCMPDEVWHSFTFRIYRDANRPISFNESYLGIGCVYSCQNYGQSKNWTDEQFLQAMRDSGSHQASSVVDRADELCDHVGIFTNSSGYSVRPVFNTVHEVVTDIKRNELPVDKAMAVGRAVYNAGGHGTMAAARLDTLRGKK